MLEVKNLSVGYEGRYIIEKVNLSFESGKIYAIIGKNGCGKSGLLMNCAGLQLPKGGLAFLDGVDLTDTSTNRIAYMTPLKNSDSTTVEQVMAQNSRKRLSEAEKRRIQSALGAMRASGLSSIPVNKLSNGERQRVMIAKLFMQDADYLLMDEPTNYLDVGFKQVFQNQLLRLKEEGKTVIFVTQDLDFALRHSDEIVAIDLGREVCTGKPEVLVANGTLKRIFKANIAM